MPTSEAAIFWCNSFNKLPDICFTKDNLWHKQDPLAYLIQVMAVSPYLKRYPICCHNMTTSTWGTMPAFPMAPAPSKLFFNSPKNAYSSCLTWEAHVLS